MQAEVNATKRGIRYAPRQRMTSPSIRWQQTPRDREILAALDLCPLEAADILQLSETFTQPFTSLRRVQERLKVLTAARQVCSWRYATTGESGGASPLYYKLSLDGYRTLHRDERAQPPTKRYLHQISPGRHRHQQKLTQYIVKTHVAARRSGLQITDVYAENTHRIETPYGHLYPDRCHSLVMPSAFQAPQRIELDNSTETIWSTKEQDSIEMKMRKYLHDLAACNYAYRVQFVVTGAKQRLTNILAAAKKLQPRTDFCPFYVVHLSEYIAADNPFLAPIFASARNNRVGLLRSEAEHFSQDRRNLPSHAAVC
jgi:hypothetical protein